VTRLRQFYGASPGHFAALLVGAAIAAYAVSRVPDLGTLRSIAIWFAFLLVAHDLMLFPVYAVADRTLVWFRNRSGAPRVPWTNYVRVPVALSGILLIAWFPLVLRLPSGYDKAAGRSADPYLWHWLGVTAVLASCSGLLYLARLLSRQRRTRRKARRAAGTAGTGR
jgi:hypothetical protein